MCGIVCAFDLKQDSEKLKTSNIRNVKTCQT